MIFDEHSGEAGIETRLEAFVDMIELKKKGIKRFKKVKLGDKTKKGYVGLDVGSVSTKAILIEGNKNIDKFRLYLASSSERVFCMPSRIFPWYKEI